MSGPPHSIIFGPFEYDPGIRELRKFGRRIRVQAQPLQVLAVLLERPGEVVTREELQRRIWGEAAYGDFQHGLNAAVNKLRQTLGDSAGQAHYIETSPGLGYRFVAPMQVNAAATVIPAEESGAAVLAVSQGPRPAVWYRAAGLAAVLLAAAGMYWLSMGSARRVEPGPAVRFSIEPPAGSVLEPASSRQSFGLSPDGRRLAFTAVSVSGAASIFVRDFDQLEPRQIPGTNGANSLFWAPDNQSLVFTAGGKLKRVKLGGGDPAVLCDLPPRIFSGTFLDAGKILISGGVGSHTVSSSGGPTDALTEHYRWPQLLPGSDLVLHTVWDPRSRRHVARVARPGDAKTTRDLLQADSRVMFTESRANPGQGYLLYVRAGNLMAQPFDPRGLNLVGEARVLASKLYSFFPSGAADFSVSQNGVLAYLSHTSRSQLAWVDRGGRTVATVGPANVAVKAGRLSPDGRHIAASFYEVERGAQNLWLIDTATSSSRLLTPESGLRDAPVWAPDSKQLAFLNAFGDRPPGLAVRGAGSSDPERHLPRLDLQLPGDWSPDGRFLAFLNTGTPLFENQTQSDVWLVDFANQDRLIPLLATPFFEANPAFSPDGRWIAFTSSESGRPEVYLQSFVSGPSPAVAGERHLVSRSGAAAIRWRRDGRELYYLSFDGRIHAISVMPGPKPRFGSDQVLFSISPEARAAAPSVLGFDVSPDGQRFLVPMVSARQPSNLIVVQNWESELLRADTK